MIKARVKLINCINVKPKSEKVIGCLKEHQILVQLRSGVSTRKVVALVSMNQYFVAHLRNDVGGEIERQRDKH